MMLVRSKYQTLLLAVLAFSHVVTKAQGWTMAMISGEDKQHDVEKKGFMDACDRLGPNVTCEIYTDLIHQLIALNMTQEWVPTGGTFDDIQSDWRDGAVERYQGLEPLDGKPIPPCVTLIKWFIQRGDVDAMVVQCGHKDVPPVLDDAHAAGIPIAVVNSGDAHKELGHFDTFIGSDPDHVGRTMARTLKQLRPEGGHYVAFYNGGTGFIRYLGFKEEIEKDNNRPDRAHWSEAPVNYTTLGLGWQYEGDDLACDGEHKGWGPFGYRDAASYHLPGNPFVQGIQGALEHAVESGANAVVMLYGYPLTNVNYTVVVDKYRDKGVLWLGLDGTDDNLNYMAQNYVDALVGEQTYQIGWTIAQTLYKMLTEGVDSVPNRIATKLINYNLVPEELPPLQVNQNLIGDLKYAGLVGFGIVAVGVVLCTCWTLWNREAVVVKASQPFFLAMTASGVLIMASMLIPMSFDDAGEAISDSYATAICMSIPWLGFTGFSITFSAMFSKTWRVNQFFKSSNAQARIRVKERDVMIPFLATFTLSVIILICWTVIDPLMYVRNFEDGTDLWNREIESVGRCLSKGGVIPYLVPLALINLVVLAIACWQAYEARDIKSEFAEAKYIAMTVFSLTQGFLSGLPIVAVARERPDAFYLVLTALVLGVSFVVLSLIFVPKVLMQRRYGKMSVRDQRAAMMASVRLSARMDSSGPGSGSQAFRSGSGSRPTNNATMQRIQEEVPIRKPEEAPPEEAPVRAEDVNNNLSSTDNCSPGNELSGSMVAKPDGRRIVSSYLDDDDDEQEVGKPAGKSNVSSYLDDDDDEQEVGKPAGKSNVSSTLDDDDDEQEVGKPAGKSNVSSTLEDEEEVVEA